MDLQLIPPKERPSALRVSITGSKSESNRMLILQALYPQLRISNLSNSDDTRVLTKALSCSEDVIDIHHAGTAMRFLTAYLASRPNRSVTLTGSERMQQRPIRILVDALNSMGANISYKKNVGYPPLRIEGANLSGKSVSIAANTSSQYLSALLLIGPSLPQGLILNLEGEITSRPYLEMTLSLLQEIGVETAFEGNQIRVSPFELDQPRDLIVESDWSSASYFYSLVALSAEMTVTLTSYKPESLQGDAALTKIYAELGVQSKFDPTNASLVLSKRQGHELPDRLELNLADTPDLAQTIAASCAGLGIGCHLTGLHTLKIKETDRLEALKAELGKLGALISVGQDWLTLDAGTKLIPNQYIETYHDHRMAMAIAPLALYVPMTVLDAGVVSKSYPSFWSDLAMTGIGQVEG
ncbi:3-phosphoshikimate 1-carboxyvinyltransferase [Aureitalea marina]|uniref:3-phosphoshikimate 1-carboxyvinyltransferase n=1 Tax=Aureitalea marina TaxID=930804 RepID=A0A2S7KM32_9FLAO|nr:3-phosphoshikimate 1-carboxyvinyltransferase [Aureitalea marina]PQB03662.1 3-phosphoshikimate 1-carboxyvinyltransferase [Aureitalea marina]